MKFKQDDSRFVHSDQAMSGTGFQIKATAKTFKTLINTLYRYKEEAVARETISNADDAHRLRDQQYASVYPSPVNSVYLNAAQHQRLSTNSGWLAPKDRPFEIHAPTEHEPYYELTDYGVGLPLERIIGTPIQREVVEIQNIDGQDVEVPTGVMEYVFNDSGKVMYTGGMYTTLFDSPKDNDNNQIGGFGLGAKSPSTISDSYQVETRFNGEKHIVFMYEDDQGMPRAELVTADEQGFPAPIPMAEGEDFNGMTVRVPVTVDRLHRFHLALCKVLRFVETPFLCTNTRLEINRPEFSATFHQTKMSFEGNGRHHAVQGGVVYPIEVGMLASDIQEFFGEMKTDSYTFFPIGSINMQPSREDLEYDRFTIEALEDSLGQAMDGIKEFISHTRTPQRLIERINCFERLHGIFGGKLVKKYLPSGLYLPKKDKINPFHNISEELPSLGKGNDPYRMSRYVHDLSYSVESNAISLSDNYDTTVGSSDLYPVELSDGVEQPQIIVVHEGIGYNSKHLALRETLAEHLSEADRKKVKTISLMVTSSFENSILRDKFKFDKDSTCVKVMRECLEDPKKSGYKSAAALKAALEHQHYSLKSTDEKLLSAYHNALDSTLRSSLSDHFMFLRNQFVRSPEYRTVFKDLVSRSFEPYGCRVLFTNDLEKPKASVSKKAASGIVLYERTKGNGVHVFHVYNSQELIEMIEKSQETGRPYVYVELHNRELDDPKLLTSDGTKYNLKEIKSKFNTVNQLYLRQADSLPIEKPFIIGVRKGGLKVLKDYPECFIHAKDYFEQLADAIVDEKLIRDYVEDLSWVKSVVAGSDIQEVKETITNLSKYIPEVEKELVFYKQFFSNKIDENDVISKDLPKWVTDIIENDPLYDQIKRHVTRRRDWWAAKYKELRDKYGEYFSNAHRFTYGYTSVRGDIFEYMELEELYRITGIEKNSIARKHERDYELRNTNPSKARRLLKYTYDCCETKVDDLDDQTAIERYVDASIFDKSIEDLKPDLPQAEGELIEPDQLESDAA